VLHVGFALSLWEFQMHSGAMLELNRGSCSVNFASSWRIKRTKYMARHGLCKILWLLENEVCVAFYNLMPIDGEVTLLLRTLLGCHI
jgi:hypothetical protein